MTDLLAPHQRATHAEGLAIFQAVLAQLQATGWVRQRVDTLVRGDWQIRHHYSAGCWELTWERRPRWELYDAQHTTADLQVSIQQGAESRTTRIDRNRVLPSVLSVLSGLFGPHAVTMGNSTPSDNGKAVK